MTLLMRDQENLEKGIEQGREQGIYALVSSLKDLQVPEMVILQKLMEKFGLTETAAKKYLS